ncbi:MAG: tRNA (guanosine(46)-N7)-methyltransferase TrmB [Chloroflexota bacterium]
MPRGRHLRQLSAAPPDSETAVRYLLLWDDKTLHQSPASYPSLSSPTLFQNDHPLELEVGCGSGHFLCAKAADNPNINFIGVEISSKRLYAAVQTAVSHNLNNIKFIRADFKLLYPLLVADSLTAVYLHFPDPHKPKFHKRRIVDQPFLDHIWVAMRIGANLSIMTDEEPFLLDMLALVEENGRFANPNPNRYTVGFDTTAKSRYQKMWEARGLTTVHFIVTKQT